MVPRAERDADERGVRVEGDRGDGGKRAVASRGADDRRPGVPDQLGRIVAPPEDVRLHAPLLRRAVELGRARVVVPGARVDQQEGAHGGPTLAVDVGPRARQVEPNGP